MNVQGPIELRSEGLRHASVHFLRLNFTSCMSMEKGSSTIRDSQNPHTGINHPKFWMPIHYDTIEDEQTKNLQTSRKEQLLSLENLRLGGKWTSRMDGKGNRRRWKKYEKRLLNWVSCKSSKNTILYHLNCNKCSKRHKNTTPSPFNFYWRAIPVNQNWFYVQKWRTALKY